MRPPAVPVPELCEDEVYKYYINRSTNINLNVPLGEQAAEACGAGPFGGGLGECVQCSGRPHLQRGHVRLRSGAASLISHHQSTALMPSLRRPSAPPHLSPRAAKACKEDAEKFCNNTWFFGPTEGRVISCLRFG
jgi:hypothetical protein